MTKNSHQHLVPGKISPPRSVPSHIKRPEYVGKKQPSAYKGPHIYSEEDIKHITASSYIAAQAVELVGSNIQPGTTTDELDAIAHEFLISQDAYPSTLGYRGFPKSLCSSINEVICHGIPDDTMLKEGDIINIDITAYKNGFHGDTSQTFIVGETDQARSDLVERTHESMMRGIKSVAPGRRINVIGRAINSYAKRFGYGVVRDFTGHGVGAAFHTGLIVPHYDTDEEFTDIIEVGMVFTIEPMLNLGTREWTMWKDGWTVVTEDLKPSAQFEHTVVVTETGAKILTTTDR